MRLLYVLYSQFSHSETTEIFEVDAERLTKFAYYMIAAYTDSVASSSDIKIDGNYEKPKVVESISLVETPTTTPSVPTPIERVRQSSMEIEIHCHEQLPTDPSDNSS